MRYKNLVDDFQANSFDWPSDFLDPGGTINKLASQQQTFRATNFPRIVLGYEYRLTGVSKRAPGVRSSQGGVQVAI